MAAAARVGIQKKTAHALEPEREDIVKRRQDWFDGQPASLQCGFQSDRNGIRRVQDPFTCQGSKNRHSLVGRRRLTP